MLHSKHFISAACLLASALSLWANTQTLDQPTAPTLDDCSRLSRVAVVQVENGHYKEAEDYLSKALIQTLSRREDTCAALVLYDLGSILLDSGRIAQSEHLVERELYALEQRLPPNDPALLRPLYVLYSARWDQGKIGAARNTFTRIQGIPLETPEDGVFFHNAAAPLLASQGRYLEAESECLAALKALQQSEGLNTVSAATVFEGLGFIHMRQHRFEEARQEIDRALTIFEEDKKTVANDLVKILSLRALLHTKLSQWDAAETDLLQAISITNQHPEIDPIEVARVLRRYAGVLRKSHRARDARSIEARARALETHPAVLVDVTQLSGNPAGREY